MKHRSMPRRRIAALVSWSLALSPLAVGVPAVRAADGPGHVAGEATARQAPGDLESALWADPERIPALYRAFGAQLADPGTDARQRDDLLHYVMGVAELRARRLAGASDAPADSLSLLSALLQVDPRRFHRDPEFRRRVAAAWPDVTLDDLPGDFRLRLVERLADLATDDFELLEPAAIAWDVARRDTSRRLDPQAEPTPSGPVAMRVEMRHVELGAIEASFFSSPDFVGAESTAALLASVRRTSPERRILVLADHDIGSAIETALRARGVAGVDVLPSLGIDYSPWPRDPMSWTWRDGGERGSLHVVLRDNVQRGREADLWMGRALIQGLPDDLDRAWGEPTWQRSEQPFHNGQILDAGGVSWVGIHSLEPRILELLGLHRVPVDRFAGEPGARFVEAARRAAEDLARLRRRPVRFVHSLPEAGGDGAARAVSLHGLGGGAGIDLDSVLTLLPRGDAITALVADVDAGSELLRELPEGELAGLSAYGLAADAGLRERLLRAHESPASRTLDRFLERIAEHLRGEGLRVRRLPLLRIDDPSVVPSTAPEPFLITWNNVVLEQRGEQAVAEGFSSLLPSADRVASRTFADAGYQLRLHPPLVESVLRNGGFRCASQHVRRVPVRERVPVDTPPVGP